jgi:hypothetical protein
MKSLRVQDAKGKSEPVLLGSLDVGDRFIYQNKEWKVMQQEWSRPRAANEGKARCWQINTPVILNLNRDMWVSRV